MLKVTYKNWNDLIHILPALCAIDYMTADEKQFETFRKSFAGIQKYRE